MGDARSVGVSGVQRRNQPRRERADHALAGALGGHGFRPNIVRATSHRGVSCRDQHRIGAFDRADRSRMRQVATERQSLRNSGAVPIAPDPTCNPGNLDIDRAGKGNVRGRAAVSMAPPAVSASPRAVMLAALSAGMTSALAVGDMEAARVAHEAIGRLLGSPSTPAGVVDLAAERERRAGG